MFATESWGRSPMVRRRADSFCDLLDVDVVERLLSAPARRPTVRLVRSGAPVPVGEYCRSLRLGGVVVDDVVDVPRVMPDGNSGPATNSIAHCPSASPRAVNAQPWHGNGWQPHSGWW